MTNAANLASAAGTGFFRNAFINSLAIALGLTSAQVDALFISANQMEV